MYNSTYIAFGTLFALFVGVWVMVDASKRKLDGISSFLLGFGTFLFLCIVLPLWLLFRPPIPNDHGLMLQEKPRPAKKRHSPSDELSSDRCPACGERVAPEDAVCPSCGIHFFGPDTEAEQPAV